MSRSVWLPKLVRNGATSGIAIRRNSIRSIAQVVQTGTAGYRKLVTNTGTASGWVSETAARPMTNTPTFTEIAPPSGELYANPAASQAMLDDAGFDLETWLANEIAMRVTGADVLVPVYEKVWERIGARGNLAEYIPLEVKQQQ